jgi:hypothetical protein
VSGFGHRYFGLPSRGYQFNSLTLDICDLISRIRIHTASMLCGELME